MKRRRQVTWGILWSLVICLPMHGDDVVYEGALPPCPAPVFVPLVVGGSRLDFMGLHLSANTMTLDTKHQSLLGERMEDEKRVSASGDAEFIGRYRPSSQISLGALPLTVEGVGVSSLSRLYTFTGFPVDGLLGVEPLMDCRLELFYGEEKLRIRKGGVREMPGFASAPVSFIMGLPVVELEVHGIVEHFFLDSGGNTALSLNEKTFERLVDAGFLKREETPIGTGSDKGHAQVPAGKVLNLKLFGRKLDGMLVSSIKGSQNKLGTAFLMGFDSVLDLPGRRFWYRPVKIKHPVLDPELMLGMRMIFFKGSVVGIAMQKGGPAEAAGISQYDRLDRLGTLGRGAFNLISLQQACRNHQNEEVDIEFYQHSTDKNIQTKMKLPAAIFTSGFPLE